MTGPHDFRGVFRTDRAACDVYSESAGVHRITPRAVAVPADAADLVQLVRWAGAAAHPLIPRGSGSSMAGGAVGDGVIVDTSTWRAIAEPDPSRSSLRCEVGATRQRVNAAAARAGLRFPVDPSSGAFASIGGMLATNAAGPRCMAFGAMRQWVRAIHCVFADGSSAWITRGRGETATEGVLAAWATQRDSFRSRCERLAPRATRKESSGYGLAEFAATGDLIDLLVGSEGTLAFFTEAELVLSERPLATASVLSAWSSLDAAVRGADLAREAGAVACELLDATFLRVASTTPSFALPADAEAVLLTEFEGASPQDAAARAVALLHASRAAGASHTTAGLDVESEQALWAIRHSASPTIARLYPHLRSMQIVEDGCVPPQHLVAYITGVRRALAAVNLPGIIFGHAGDAHLHVNALVDVSTLDWRPRVERLWTDVHSLIAQLGGTPAGEHGDGRLRTPALSSFWSSEARELFSDLKRLFDPKGLLNPGVIVGAGENGSPLSQIKYDPALPALDPRAAVALSRVERERAYNAQRLELLDSSG